MLFSAAKEDNLRRNDSQPCRRTELLGKGLITSRSFPGTIPGVYSDVDSTNTLNCLSSMQTRWFLKASAWRPYRLTQALFVLVAAIAGTLLVTGWPSLRSAWQER